MSERKLLVIDTETGGLDPSRHAICSLAAVVLHEGLLDGHLYLVINDEEGELDPEAMAVNGFTRESLRKDGVSIANAVDQLEEFLLFNDWRDPRKVVLAGQNVPFDTGFVQRLYRLGGGKYEYSKRFSRRYVDLMTAGALLDQAGRIELAGGSASLDEICRSIGVPLPRENGHNALEDATATARALSRAIGMMKHTDWPAHPVN